MSENSNHDARMFVVECRFQQMARRAGGVQRNTAIEKAQAKIDEMKPGFADWLDREMQDLVKAIQADASNASMDDWIGAAHLHSRRLRDVGTTMGFELITFVANNLCEIFDTMRAGAEYRSDLIDCHIEALMLVRQERYRGLRPEELPELTSGLRRVVEYASTLSARAAK